MVYNYIINIYIWYYYNYIYPYYYSGIMYIR